MTIKLAPQMTQVVPEWFRAAMDVAADGFAAVCPHSHKFLYVNQAYASLLGYSPVEMVGKTWMDFTYASDTGGDLASFKAIMSDSGTSFKMSKRYVHKLGHLVPINICVHRYPTMGNLALFTVQIRAVPLTEANLVDFKHEMLKSVDSKIIFALEPYQGLEKVIRQFKILWPFVLFCGSMAINALRNWLFR